MENSKIEFRKQWASAVLMRLCKKHEIEWKRGWQSALSRKLGIAQQRFDEAMRGKVSIEWLSLLALKNKIDVNQGSIGLVIAP